MFNRPGWKSKNPAAKEQGERLLGRLVHQVLANLVDRAGEQSTSWSNRTVVSRLVGNNRTHTAKRASICGWPVGPNRRAGCRMMFSVWILPEVRDGRRTNRRTWNRTRTNWMRSRVVPGLRENMNKVGTAGSGSTMNGGSGSVGWTTRSCGREHRGQERTKCDLLNTSSTLKSRMSNRVRVSMT
mmetsp:Transcript_91471/g.258294  ORF Transcript_91471/g.258294 Transcript_91471/m.258294 type:complete len:184 (-) Transcript_91471:182-733(-)